MNTKQSPYDDIITRHLLDKFDKSIMAEMLAECLTPAGLETPMKMFIVRVDGLSGNPDINERQDGEARPVSSPSYLAFLNSSSLYQGNT